MDDVPRDIRVRALAVFQQHMPVMAGGRFSPPVVDIMNSSVDALQSGIDWGDMRLLLNAAFDVLFKEIDSITTMQEAAMVRLNDCRRDLVEGRRLNRQLRSTCSALHKLPGLRGV